MTKKWPEVKLGDILTERRETPDPVAIATGQIKIVSKIGFDSGKIELRNSSETNTKMITIMPGDLVLSGINAAKGAIAIYPDDEEQPAAATIHYSSYEVNPEKASMEYLWWLLRSNLFKDILDRHMPGGIKTELKAKRLLPIPVPLPTLAEQNQIRNKIKSVFQKLSIAQKLHSACELENQALLTSLRNERFLKLSHAYKGVRLDSVSDTRLGKMLSRNQASENDGYPYMRNANIQWDRIDLSSVYRMHVDRNDARKYNLIAGDILVCEGGDIGKAAIWNEEIQECLFQKALHRIRVNQEKIIPRYLLHHIIWAAEQHHFEDIKTQTTIAHLTGVKLKAYNVVIPSVQEQKETAESLDDLKRKTDSIKRRYQKSQKELNALMPSILDKAFKGEL